MCVCVCSSSSFCMLFSYIYFNTNIYIYIYIYISVCVLLVLYAIHIYVNLGSIFLFKDVWVNNTDALLPPILYLILSILHFEIWMEFLPHPFIEISYFWSSQIRKQQTFLKDQFRMESPRSDVPLTFFTAEPAGAVE